VRRINKDCNLSVVYKTWEEGLEAGDFDHPKYNSSRGEYYLDVVMNLLHCQKGLCAYTEKRLCSEGYYTDTRWSNHRYVNPDSPSRPQIKGQLEHFDKNLKDKKGWLWDNLFVVDTDINTKVKKSNTVDPILKPDRIDYDEFALLQYDYRMHLFRAKSTLSNEIQQTVNKGILTLGLNFDAVKEERRIYLEPRLKMIDLGVETWDSVTVEEYPTAFEMIRTEKTSLPLP
jgi:hypothetical protein